MLSWKINEGSLKRLAAQLQEMDKKMVNKVIRKGAKAWAKETEGAIKSNITWNEKTLQRHITHKIKMIRGKGRRKGYKAVWCGVGIRGGRKLTNKNGDAFWAASKARWYQDGFRVWNKGQKSGRKTRKWREGLKGNLGPVIYDTKFITKAAEAAMPKAEGHIIKAFQEAIMEMNKTRG